VGLGGVILWRIVDVIILAFVATMIAVGLRGLSDEVRRWSRLPDSVCLTVVVVGVGAVIAGVFWLFGAQIAAQYDDLAIRLPLAVRRLSSWLGSTTWGHYAIGHARGVGFDGVAAPAARYLARTFGSLGKGFSYAVLAIVCGVFLAIEPGRYLRGVLELTPESVRPAVQTFLVRTGLDLRRWLFSRLIVMLAIGVLASFGLWALGIEAPFALGITGGLLTFIPLVGALMAAVPAVIMGFAKDPIYAVWTGLLFWAVHFVEGTFITPYVQNKTINFPPVVTILSLTAFTLLFGAWGILFAAPMTLVLILAVRIFYIDRGLELTDAVGGQQPTESDAAVEPAAVSRGSSG
jgi:predicted PurR-regulated permease PerM